MFKIIPFEERLAKHANTFHKVVAFDPVKEHLLQLDFTEKNRELSADIFENTKLFGDYINQKIKTTNSVYAIGGYNEQRALYSMSKVFDTKGAGPRRLHLGIDIWGNAATPVFAPLGGMVHSFAFNNSFGDYGATIILLHQLDGLPFYTLYGHLSLNDIKHLREGVYISRGQVIGHFGELHENGEWPPHLHFQVIKDMQYKKGDYPGVCAVSEKEKYLANCPNPDLILQMMQYAVKG